MYSLANQHITSSQIKPDVLSFSNRANKDVQPRNTTQKTLPRFHDFRKIPLFQPSIAPIQAKLKMNAPGDQFEREAEHISEKVLKGGAIGNISSTGATVQKQSATNPGGDAIANPTFVNQIRNNQGKGRPIEAGTRSFMEGRFGANFGKVRIHADENAAQLNQQINAQAFTLGQDIYFNRGRYRPNSLAGKKLLAHELTHTLQQPQNTIRKQESNSSNRSTANQTTSLIVENNITPVSGQMKKSAFLRRLNNAVCSTVDRELKGTPYSSDNCPYITRIFSKFRNSPVSSIERLLARYAPGAARAQSALELIQLILRRVRRAVRSWKRRGRLSDVPEDVQALLAELRNVPQSNTAGKRQNRNIQFKAKAGGAQPNHSPTAVMQRLGEGQPLQSGIRSKMEGAFGTSFSNVQIHNDNQAAGLSRSLNARAFTVGNHIAFSNGEYRPGTLIGDALIAHELAHVIQQQQGIQESSLGLNSQTNVALENEADRSAIGAVLSTLSGLGGNLNKLRKRVMPTLKSGLQLQRCPAAPVGAAAVAGTTGGTVALTTGGTTAATTIFGLTAAEATVAAGLTIGTAVVANEAIDAARRNTATTAATATTILMASAGNVADTGIMEEVYALISATVLAGAKMTICEALAQLMEQAKRAGDKARIQRIKATQKAHGCRASRQSKDKK